ncbi:interleukin-18 receptor accessory protein-like [Clinocottus analis]|uniref:interleukin-18 receptor accessory protein-like n=1 Tax=Clinocottus analis TaxID=304258 RepID=UPI0035C18869
MKDPLKLLMLLCSLRTGAGPWTAGDADVRAGEMAALLCPLDGPSVMWTGPSSQDTDLTRMSSAEQTRMGLLLHGRSLVVLRASVLHQGNYSCSLGNASSRSWFRLTVSTTRSREQEQRTQYPQRCYAAAACTLSCPEVNVPAASTPNISSNGTVWHKEGESEPTDGYFSSVQEKHQGVYTCTRSYLCYTHLYNMTFRVALEVKPERKSGQAEILSPRSGVVNVELGDTVVVECRAVVYSDFDEVFWLVGTSEVETNSSFPVFYNYSRESDAAEMKITASLVFRKVSEEDLSKGYTCKLDPLSGPSSSVSITLTQKAAPRLLPLALGLAAVAVMILVTVVVLVKLRKDVVLFLRGSLCCRRSASDGKSYDAFLMCYQSDTGLKEDDRKHLQSVLEERFGYSLCLYERDVSPGKAAAEAVLDCVEQSRTVVLVPASPDVGPDAGPGSGLLSAVHAALVERQTRLVFIQTETSEAPRSGSLPEALRLLGEAADCVTWKGMSSIPHASSFWKQLRYHLPAPQQASRMKLLPF